jgi:hypothetical protein
LVLLGLKPGIPQTDTGCFWDSKWVFLGLKLGISGAQTRYFWDSNSTGVFLRLKPGIFGTKDKPYTSETQITYYGGSKPMFLRLKTAYF